MTAVAAAGPRDRTGAPGRGRRVAVLGGGITGLAAAHRASELGADVVLLEASERLGGVIETERHDGWLLELGPEFGEPAGLEIYAPFTARHTAPAQRSSGTPKRAW